MSIFFSLLLTFFIFYGDVAFENKPYSISRTYQLIQAAKNNCRAQ